MDVKSGPLEVDAPLFSYNSEDLKIGVLLRVLVHHVVEDLFLLGGKWERLNNAPFGNSEYA